MEKKNSIVFLLNSLVLARSNYSQLRKQCSGLIKVVFISCLITFLSWVITPPAQALTQIKLSDISYKECPPELAQGAVISSGSASANCFIVIGKAENGTNKTVYDADIFGRIYDANNDSVMQNRTRLGSIAEVPPGISDFELRISVPANQPLPLKLKQFKAAGFSGQVRR
ncbi:biotin carboxylase [Komarekiella delphini-convector]|uniref:biotin carboxylase n=1 Tax=Komarekiella delphini-convector TaxID=3050158 RepID=UPI001CD8F4C1|nr:biotin carboxylase [Komarekiella delphini-convector]